MKKINRKATILSAIILTLSFSAAGIYGQGEAKDDKPSDEKQKHGSYLKVSRLKDSAVKYKAINKKMLTQLMVIISNFGEEGDKSKYEELVGNYTEGVKDLYKRKYIEAGETLTQNYKDINALFKKMAERYRQRASELLNQCAESIVEKEFSISPSSDQSPEATAKVRKSVHENSHRLSIGYDHFNMGSTFENDEVYSLAIIHYRGAIAQGINILIDLAETDEKKDEVRQKYKVDLSDVENQLAKKSS